MWRRSFLLGTVKLQVLHSDGRMKAGTSAFAARALAVEVLVWTPMGSCTDGKLELGAEGYAEVALIVGRERNESISHRRRT